MSQRWYRPERNTVFTLPAMDPIPVVPPINGYDPIPDQYTFHSDDDPININSWGCDIILWGSHGRTLKSNSRGARITLTHVVVRNMKAEVVDAFWYASDVSGTWEVSE